MERYQLLGRSAAVRRAKRMTRSKRTRSLRANEKCYASEQELYLSEYEALMEDAADPAVYLPSIRHRGRWPHSANGTPDGKAPPEPSQHNKRNGSIGRRTAGDTRREPEYSPADPQESPQTAQHRRQVVENHARNRFRLQRTAEMAPSTTAEASHRVLERLKDLAKACADAMEDLTSYLLAGGWIAALLLICVVVLFGGCILLFGGMENSASPLSDSVLRYEGEITAVAEQYGLADYVPLIEAVMMQESGGEGLDPMQSSEGAYNTRYPQQPNGITDPLYSIECGIRELGDCLSASNVSDPLDIEHIRLALQGYNFGPGYISWAVSRYGGYSLENAAEFSTAMAEKLGWSSYGDVQYVPHVLRYYSCANGILFSRGTMLAEVARSQLGNEGGEVFWRWYGFEQHENWCACFVSWCADQCGLLEDGTVPKFALCTDGVSWFMEQGRWRTPDAMPSVGDLVFFDWNGDGQANHVGIVSDMDASYLYTVEGNSGDMVKERRYPADYSKILGYGTLL